MKVTVIYGSDNGNTRAAANQIATKLGGEAIDINKASTADFESSDLLVLGSPTYGFGDLQDDWDARIGVLKEANLLGKKVALFGLGDQITYVDTFADALGLLYDAVLERGAIVVGATATDGYDFSESHAVRDGRFVGLVLDDDNQGGETDERIARWVSQLTALAAAA